MSTRSAAPAAAAKQDPRFAGVGTDPRFQRFPKKQKRVEIDERFAGMFTDPSFQQPARVDKRGRKVKAGKVPNDIKAFYRLQDQADDQPGRAPAAQRPSAGGADADADASGPHTKRRKGAESRSMSTETQSLQQPHASEDEDEAMAQEERRQAHRKARTRTTEMADESDEEAAKAAERYARMRGLVDAESSSDEEDDDIGALETNAFASAELATAWGVGALAANPDEDVPLVDEDTSRLALVDLDWDKLRAVDIVAALRSFLPAGGSIKRVTVYPSDYGRQRMQQEAAQGPTGIYRSARANGSAKPFASELDDEYGLEADEAEDAAAAPADVVAGSDSEADSAGGEDADDEVDREALRLYERSKLRWFYAVAECDSARTAAHLYAECDGMEFGLSACKFDLRFVPDTQSFEGREQRDSAMAVPDNYEPPNFQTVALQHTNVQLTWDADDDGRKRALSAKRATQMEIREDDFKAYLASSSGESSDDAHEDAVEKQKQLRSLLLSDVGDGGNRALGRSGGKGWAAAADGGEDSEDDDDDGEDDRRPQRDVDMEVVFQPGLEGLGERLLAGKRGKAGRSSETVWDAYMRKRKCEFATLPVTSPSLARWEKREAAKAMGRRDASDSDDVSDPEASPRGAGAEQDGHDPFFQQDDDVFDDPWFAANDGEAAANKDDGRTAGATVDAPQNGEHAKSEKRRAARAAAKEAAAEEERRKADLEMLMMPDAELRSIGAPTALAVSSGAASRLQKPSRKDAIKQKKARKAGASRADSDEDVAHNSGAPFQPDLEDPRFSGLFRSQDFAIDPTDPRFKQMGGGASAIATAVAKRRSSAIARDPAAADAAHSARAPAGKKEGLQLDATVAALKRKLGASSGGRGGVARPARPQAMVSGKKQRKQVAGRLKQ